MTIGQQAVAINMAFGVVGELFLDGPLRGQPGIIDSDGVTPAFNRVGRVFTHVAAADGHVTVGGSGVFAGILANPKVYPLFGTASGGSLAPSLDLGQYAIGEFVYDTTGIIVSLAAAANIGDLVDYVVATGVIVTRAATTPASGAQRVAFASNVATVTLMPAGSPQIKVGTVLVSGGKTTTVLSLGTGTGGNGTYNVGTIADAGAAAFAFSNADPVSGNANVPGFQVVRYNIPGAGLAVIGNIN